MTKTSSSTTTPARKWSKHVGTRDPPGRLMKLSVYVDDNDLEAFRILRLNKQIRFTRKQLQDHMSGHFGDRLAQDIERMRRKAGVRAMHTKQDEIDDEIAEREWLDALCPVG